MRLSHCVYVSECLRLPVSLLHCWSHHGEFAFGTSPYTFLRWGNVIYSYHTHKQPLLGIELKTESQFTVFTVMCTCKVSMVEYKSMLWAQHSTRFVLSQFPSKTAFIIPQLIAFGATWKWIGSNTVIFVRFTPGIIRKSLSHFAKFNLSSYYVIWFVWKFGSPFITLSTRHFMTNCKVIPMKTNENSFAYSFHCWTFACFAERRMCIWSTLYWEEMGTWRK